VQPREKDVRANALANHSLPPILKTCVEDGSKKIINANKRKRAYGMEYMYRLRHSVKNSIDVGKAEAKKKKDELERGFQYDTKKLREECDKAKSKIDGNWTSQERVIKSSLGAHIAWIKSTDPSDLPPNYENLPEGPPRKKRAKKAKTIGGDSSGAESSAAETSESEPEEKTERKTRSRTSGRVSFNDETSSAPPAYTSSSSSSSSSLLTTLPTLGAASTGSLPNSLSSQRTS